MYKILLSLEWLLFPWPRQVYVLAEEKLYLPLQRFWVVLGHLTLYFQFHAVLVNT